MRVLPYYPWGYFEPTSCGADLIASNQLEYLRRRGWGVDVLLLSRPDRARQADAFRRRYPWLRSVSPIEQEYRIVDPLCPGRAHSVPRLSTFGTGQLSRPLSPPSEEQPR